MWGGGLNREGAYSKCGSEGKGLLEGSLIEFLRCYLSKE